MATKEDVAEAVGCLSVVFPQFVQREMALLTDQIVAGIQNVTDPLSDLLNTNLDSLIDDVAVLSEGDVWQNAAEAGLSYGAYLAKRELTELVNPPQTDDEIRLNENDRKTSYSDRIRGLRTTITMAMALYEDLPYVAVQQMCETLLELIDLKLQNLTCLRRHIVQLVNTVVVLAHNQSTYQDQTLQNLDDVVAALQTVQTELARSQRTTTAGTTFDALSFERARVALQDAGRILAPQNDGTSILDVVDILAFESVTTGQVTRENFMMSTLVIPQLLYIIEVESAAILAQVEAINTHISKVAQALNNFVSAGTGSEVKAIRSRLIREITSRVTDLQSQVQYARRTSTTRDASARSLAWVARIKSILATMDRVKNLSLQVGSTEGADKELVLNNAYIQLVTDLASLENTNTTDGVEDASELQSKVLGLTKGARRIMNELASGQATEASMKNFHAQSAAVAKRQTSAIDESISLATQQKAICEEYISVVGDLPTRENFDKMVGGMWQLGLDRGVDLLMSGEFQEFVDSGIEGLSYISLAVQCLTNALRATDDTRTQIRLTTIRDELIGKQTNLNLAATDSADSGTERIIGRLQGNITTLQKNAKTVETILADLETIAEELEVDLDLAKANARAFAENVDTLVVGAGGRLASQLEELGEYPQLGVPLC